MNPAVWIPGNAESSIPAHATDVKCSPTQLSEGLLTSSILRFSRSQYVLQVILENLLYSRWPNVQKWPISDLCGEQEVEPGYALMSYKVKVTGKAMLIDGILKVVKDGEVFRVVWVEVQVECPLEPC